MKRILIALMLCLIASTALATDWYVRPSGGDYGSENGTSYADAWDGFSNIVWGTGGVVAGDTLWVCGTHAETLTVGVSGTDGNVITIDGGYDGDEGVIDGNGGNLGGFIISSQNYITVNNLTITNWSVECFLTEGTSHHIIFNDCIGTYSGNQAFQNVDTVSVTYNRCIGAHNDDGFTMRDSAACIINDCTFEYNSRGLAYIGSSTLVANNTTLNQNTLNQIYQHSTGASSFSVISIDAATGTSHAIDVLSGTFSINRAVVRNVVSGKSSMVFRSVATITHCGNNVFIGDSNVGRGVWTAVDVDLKNNIFIDLEHGVYVNSGTVTSEYSCYFNNTSDNYNVSSVSNLITTDPLLNSSYHLTKSSPCRDAGTIISGITTEYYNTAPDIGAYEYTGGSGGQFMGFGLKLGVGGQRLTKTTVAASASNVTIGGANVTIGGEAVKILE